MTDDREQDVILLVEDTLTDQALTFHELRAHGVRNKVVVAESGTEALDYLFGTGRFAERDVSVQPLVMLLDLGLPELSGLDVLRCVRADPRTETLPVIVLTGSAEETALIGSYALAARFAQKPLSGQRFYTALKKLGLLARLHFAAMVVAAVS